MFDISRIQKKYGIDIVGERAVIGSGYEIECWSALPFQALRDIEKELKTKNYKLQRVDSAYEKITFIAYPMDYTNWFEPSATPFETIETCDEGRVAVSLCQSFCTYSSFKTVCNYMKKKYNSIAVKGKNFRLISFTSKHMKRK